MRDLYIDADSLLYANACVCESRTYSVLKRGTEWRGPFNERSAAMAEIDSAADELFIATSILPFDVARDNLHNQLNGIVAEADARFGKVRVHTFLTGSGNYRDRLPSRVTYKHNRLATAKPAHLHRLREWAVTAWNAQIVHWHEADDEVAIQMHAKEGGICCSIDKDLLQIPGDHMIPKKGFIRISEKSALCRLYQQIIAGDSTDGVPGCYRVGPDGAQALVIECAREHGADLDELECELWTLALRTYEESIRKHGSKVGYTTARDAAIETARFVHLLRKRPKDPSKPQLWNPPS